MTTSAASKNFRESLAGPTSGAFRSAQTCATDDSAGSWEFPYAQVTKYFHFGRVASSRIYLCVARVYLCVRQSRHLGTTVCALKPFSVSRGAPRELMRSRSDLIFPGFNGKIRDRAEIAQVSGGGVLRCAKASRNRADSAAGADGDKKRQRFRRKVAPDAYPYPKDTI